MIFFGGEGAFSRIEGILKYFSRPIVFLCQVAFRTKRKKIGTYWMGWGEKLFVICQIISNAFGRWLTKCCDCKPGLGGKTALRDL